MRRLAPLIFLLVSCDTAPQWRGWLYPDRDNLTRSIELGPFKTFEQCQDTAIAGLRALPAPDDGDYECGYKCNFDQDLKTNVCKETRK